MRPRARERGRDHRVAPVGVRDVHGDARLLSHRVVHLDELEAVPGPDTLTWHPVRATPLIESDPERARAIAREGLELHPANPGLHWVLAKLAAAAGDHEEARAEVRKVLEAAPGADEELRGDPSLAPYLPG